MATLPDDTVSLDKGVTMAMFPKRDDDVSFSTAIPRWAVIGIFLIAVFYFMAEAREFLIPVTLAFLLFFVFMPFRRFLQRFGVGATATAAIVTLGMLTGVGGLGLLASGPISQAIENAPMISSRLRDRFEDIRTSMEPLEKAAKQIDAATGGSSTPSLSEEDAVETPPLTAPEISSEPEETAGDPTDSIDGDIPEATVLSAGGSATVKAETQPTTVAPDGTVETGAQEVVVHVSAAKESAAMQQLVALGPSVLGQTMFTLVLLFFMISSGDLLYLKIVQSFDTLKKKRLAYDALREIEASLGAYLGAITLINAVLGILIGLVMWLWDMPSPLLFGLGGFLLNFIPYIGAIAGVIISTIVALIMFEDLFTPILVGVSYLSLTAIEGQLVTPYFVSRRLKLNEVVVFMTVALWAWLWSVLGMVVAVPVLVVLRVLASHIEGMQKLGNFLAGEDPPALEPAPATENGHEAKVATAEH